MENVVICGICSHIYGEEWRESDGIPLWKNRWSNQEVIICGFCAGKMRENLIDGSERKIYEELKALDRTIKANQIGLQNVYDQFTKVTDANFIRDWTAEKKMIEKKLDDMQKTIDETFKFVNSCQKKMAVINDLYSLRNVDTVMITKLAHLLKAIEE